MIGLTYSFTNESPDAIIKGLDLNLDDEVLAIAGSGDQAFAMLGLCRKVNVFDSNLTQLKYVRRRKRAIEEGDLESFLEYHMKLEDRTLANFFRDENRFRRIKENINSLQIPDYPIEASMLNLYPQLLTANKVYLSNCFGGIFLEDDTDLEEYFFTDLRYIRGLFRRGTILYNAATPRIISEDSILPYGLKYNANKSREAKEIEIEKDKITIFPWNPGIFECV